MAIRHVPRDQSAAQLVTSYEDASDEQLMLMFQADDFKAFDVLIHRHTGLVWRVVKQYLGSAHEVEDMIQEVSLSLFQNRAAWQPAGGAKFSTWLYRVAANRCIDILRQKKSIQQDAANSGESVPSSVPSAEEKVAHKQLAKHLSGLLAELPLQQQRALRLYYYEEASMGQIAAKLDVSELAARSLIKRGKQKLREVTDPHLVS
mgnify:CR=1 FL=1